MEDQILLDDFSTFKPADENFEFQVVDKGLRIANFVIDRIVFTILGVLAFIVFGLPESISENRLLDYLFTAFIALLYYFMEATTQGKSIGKYITGTRAVFTDGSPIDGGTAFTRSFYRVVPFDALSFLGDSGGWHDRWSGTMVVKEADYKSFHGL